MIAPRPSQTENSYPAPFSKKSQQLIVLPDEGIAVVVELSLDVVLLLVELFMVELELEVSFPEVELLPETTTGTAAEPLEGIAPLVAGEEVDDVGAEDVVVEGADEVVVEGADEVVVVEGVEVVVAVGVLVEGVLDEVPVEAVLVGALDEGAEAVPDEELPVEVPDVLSEEDPVEGEAVLVEDGAEESDPVVEPEMPDPVESVPVEPEPVELEPVEPEPVEADPVESVPLVDGVDEDAPVEESDPPIDESAPPVDEEPVSAPESVDWSLLPPNDPVLFEVPFTGRVLLATWVLLETGIIGELLLVELAPALMVEGST